MPLSFRLLLILLPLSAVVFATNLVITLSCVGRDISIDNSPTIRTARNLRGNGTSTNYQIHDDECFKLPQSIRRSGTFFRDHTIQNTMSPSGIVPSFHFGAEIRPRQCQEWISADKAHYQLILEQFGNDIRGINEKTRVSFDIGANRGFYTHYLATLGMEVHAFEINPKMFNSLQHGLLFNPPNVSDQVHLYSMGISDKISVYGQEGEEGGGFLKKKVAGKTGHEIMSISIDCFLQHINMPSEHYLDFIKIDVEGFEIAVLRGALQSFDQWRIGAMLIEIGPSRWNRAYIPLELGIEEMKSLSNRFSQSFILLRAEGAHSRSCPASLSIGIIPGEARIVQDVLMYAVAMEVWEPLLTEMNSRSYDCNFWFSNA